ncbi:MAG: hypothetical protein E7Z80_06145, partial [Methanobrevibacter thaueri]|nr:hypothetical protein [Methanobrevibacter thaueri]
MKIDKKLFLCLMLVLIIALCINTSSAKEPFDKTLGSDANNQIATNDLNDTLKVNENTIVTHENGNDNYKITSGADTSTIGTENNPSLKEDEGYHGIIYVDKTGNNDNNGSINAPVADITKAIELANNATGQIIINEGTYTGYDYHITKEISITGVGNVILDADNQGRLFYMEYGDTASKIELKNIALINAKGLGAAIYSFANELILDNVTIVNTTADNYLIKSNGKLNINNSIISNSKSGNVIDISGTGDKIINNTLFENNSIVDTNSVFGVLYVSSGSGNLIVDKSKFINNTARQGIVIGNNNIGIQVTNSVFINNANTVSYGGAINARANLNVYNSIFINNKAYRDGGAIYVGFSSVATVDKSVFINNTAGATSHGDAIYNANKLTVTNSVLLTNTNHYLIYNDGEDYPVNAQNNWWGTNDNPKNLVASGYYEDDDYNEFPCPEVDVSNWVKMTAGLTLNNNIANITAKFSNSNIADGIPVTFTSNTGNLNTVVISKNAEANIIYTIDENDNTITATSKNAVIEIPVDQQQLTNIVTQDTFNQYFDDDGILKDTITFDELIFNGTFTGVSDYIIINRPITIKGYNAELKNIGIMITSEDVELNNLTLTATSSIGDLIYVDQSDVSLYNLNISYIIGDEMGNAINVKSNSNISNINLINNTIYFENHVTSDEDLVTGINFENVGNSILDNNKITASYPGLFVETYDWDYFMMGLCYVNPIRIYKSNSINFTNNNVNVSINSFSAGFPTIQELYIAGSNDILFKGNNFTMKDTITPQGTGVYLYAIECGFSNEISFIENNFDISTTGGKSGSGSAYALQIVSSEALIMDNNITCDSNGPNLGIYSPYGFGPAKELIVKNNFLNITGYAEGNDDFALISGIEVQTGYATIYNNTIYSFNKGPYGDKYPVSAISAVQYSAPTLSFDVQGNKVFTNGKYAVDILYTTEKTIVTDNYLIANTLTGDDAVYIKSGSANTVKNNVPPYPVNIIINANSVWEGNDVLVKVSVENSLGVNTTGSVTFKFNNKSSTVNLVNGEAEITLNASDLAVGENELTVDYTCDSETFKDTSNSTKFHILNGIVTQDTYLYYFNQEDNGKFFDYIPNGATLDFQGSIINPDQAVTVQMNVNKPVNIVSSTHDAYVDLNTTAGSLLGESPGNSFAITYGGSGSNVSDVYFHNTQLWFSNTHNVVLDNISNVVEDQRVGSGVGATSIRDNSTYVVLKNSYFYTRNNGGSTTFTFSWASYCTIDNCTLRAEGNVGNLLYLNIFNVVGAPSGVPLNNYNIVS